MLTQRDKILLNYLRRCHTAVTCQNIAQHCGCSVNTIRKEIRLLNDNLQSHGCAIKSIKSKGYQLIISEPEKAEAFFTENSMSQNAALANQDFNSDSRYRSYFIIRRLLTSPRPVSLVELCSSLYCSRSTLLRSLDKCEKYLSIFSLRLKSVRGYGLSITGNEYNKRICLIYQLKAFRKLDEQLQEKESKFQYTFQLKDSLLYQELRALCLECIHAFPRYQIAFINIPKLVHYLTLCITRRQYAQTISFSEKQLNAIQQNEVYELSKTVFRKIEERLHYSFSDLEYISFTPLLLAYRSVSQLSQINHSLAEYFYCEAKEAAAFIYHKFQLSCITEQETVEKLACHLYTAKYRNMFCISDDFEKQALVLNDGSYILDLCLELGTYLENKHHIALSRQEIFSFYYLFSTVLHANLNKFYPLHILLISMFGTEYAEHTAHRLLKIYRSSHLNLDTYIESIDVCEFSDIAAMQYKNYDLLITDIPSSYFHCSFPIAEIDMQTDLVKAAPLKTAFQLIAGRHYRPYIDPHILITAFYSKDDVFEFLTAYYDKELSSSQFSRTDFLKQLKARDSFISSERFNRTALITTSQSFFSKSQIFVMLNRTPITWQEERCQLFIFYNYGKEPVSVILTLEFLLTKLRKAEWSRLEQLIDNPSADFIDFLNTL